MSPLLFLLFIDDIARDFPSSKAYAVHFLGTPEGCLVQGSSAPVLSHDLEFRVLIGWSSGCSLAAAWLL